MVSSSNTTSSYISDLYTIVDTSLDSTTANSTITTTVTPSKFYKTTSYYCDEDYNYTQIEKEQSDFEKQYWINYWIEYERDFWVIDIKNYDEEIYRIMIPDTNNFRVRYNRKKNRQNIGCVNFKKI